MIAVLRHLAHESPRHRGERPATEPTCTPWEARRCAIHGVCSCVLLGDSNCLLHGPMSAHAADGMGGAS